MIVKLQNDSWDQSNDENIQWRYQHALAAVVCMTCINLLFSVFVVDVLLCQSVGIAIVFSVAVVVSFTVCVDVFVVANCFFF